MIDCKSLEVNRTRPDNMGVCKVYTGITVTGEQLVSINEMRRYDELEKMAKERVRVLVWQKLYQEVYEELLKARREILFSDPYSFRDVVDKSLGAVIEMIKPPR